MRTLILSCLLALSSAGHVLAAAPGGTQVLAKDANTHAERITDAKQYLADIDNDLALAKNGEYGRLKRGSGDQLQAARDRIADLLEGHATANALSPENRIAIFDAHTLISSILNNQDKNRVVCRKIAKTGSRLTIASECLTIAEREARAQAMRENTDAIQRMDCVPGPPGQGNPCGRP